MVNNIMKKKVWEVWLLDAKKNTNLIHNAHFETADTNANLIVRLMDEGLSATAGIIALSNHNDESFVEEVVVVEDNTMVYKIPTDVIAHAGLWSFQVTFEHEGEDYVTSRFNFTVKEHLSYSKFPRLESVERLEELSERLQDLIDASDGSGLTVAQIKNIEVNNALNAKEVNGHTVLSDVPAGANFENTEYIPSRSVTIGEDNSLVVDFSEVESKMALSPDNFEGTDVEKLQQAFDYAVENDIRIIELAREYDITGGSIMQDPSPEMNYAYQNLVFRGGKITKMDEGYVFDCESDNKRRNSPIFQNTNFEGGDNVYLHNGAVSIRQIANGCYFKKMGFVKSDTYLQTIRLINCETGQLGTSFIKAHKVFDGLIAGHRGESNMNTESYFLDIRNPETNGLSAFGFRMVDSLVEGYYNSPPIIMSTGYGIKFDGNYFESNKTSIVFEKGNSSNRINAIITRNVFGDSRSDFDIEFRGYPYAKPFVDIYENTTNIGPGKSLTNMMHTSRKFENNIYAGGTFGPAGASLYNEKNSYETKIIENESGGVNFEVELPIVGDGIHSLDEKQMIINIRFNYGSSIRYSGHLTGILSIDGFYDSSIPSTVFGANLSVLSTRNTTANINGKLDNDAIYDYWFKETGTKQVQGNPSKATVVFHLPNAKVNNSINSFSVIPFGKILSVLPDIV